MAKTFATLLVLLGCYGVVALAAPPPTATDCQELFTSYWLAVYDDIDDQSEAQLATRALSERYGSEVTCAAWDLLLADFSYEPTEEVQAWYRDYEAYWGYGSSEWE